MTPPKKKPDIRIIEHSEKFKSKPEQVVCSQSSRGHHAVLDLRASSIVKRALEKEKEK